MSPAQAALAVLVAAIWGFNFPVIRFGLDEFPPFLLAALRFVGSAVPVLFLARPALSWRDLALLGLFLFVGQFGFLFFGMTMGMPPGLASATIHTQGILTVLLAALLLGERPLARQWAGLATAGAGLLMVALSIGGDLTAIGFALTFAGAWSWAAGNIVLKRIGPAPMFAVTAWASLLPPLPLFALGLAVDGPGPTFDALARVSWTGIAVLAYLVFAATMVGYWIWGNLMARHSAAAIAPFALLVPCFGLASSAAIFGERLTGLRLAGAALVLAGLALSALPWERWLVRGKAR